MNQTEQILAQLRDVQLPTAPEGVSVWLMIATLAMLLLILPGLYRRVHRTREQWRRDALFEIRRARSMDPAAATLALAKLLRQIRLYRDRDVADDSRHTLNDLDTLFSTHWFTQAEGQIFGNALYQPHQLSEAELQALCKTLEQLIRKLPAMPSAPPVPADRRTRS